MLMNHNWPAVKMYGPVRGLLRLKKISVQSSQNSKKETTLAKHRVFYILKTELGILVFHNFKKKSQKTQQKEIDTAKTRLKEFLKELSSEK